MNLPPTADLPCFATNGEHRRLYNDFSNKILDYAQLCSSMLPHRPEFGIIGLLLPPAEYEAMDPAGAPFQLLEDPGEPEGNALNQAIQKVARANYLRERTVISHIRAWVVKALDPVALSKIRDENGNGNRTRSLQWIYERLRAEYGRVKPADLAYWALALQKDFNPANDITEWITEREGVYAKLADNGHPTSETQKIADISKMIRKGGAGIFEEPLVQFLETFDEINAERTLRALTDRLTVTANRVRGEKATSAEAGYANLVAAPAATTSATVQPTTSEVLIIQIAESLALLTKQMQQDTTRNYGNNNKNKQKKNNPTNSTQQPGYCYIHGYGFHTGEECNGDKEGNKPTGRKRTATSHEDVEGGEVKGLERYLRNKKRNINNN